MGIYRPLSYAYQNSALSVGNIECHSTGSIELMNKLKATINNAVIIAMGKQSQTLDEFQSIFYTEGQGIATHWNLSVSHISYVF